MTGQPWARNAGKFDKPSSSAPKPDQAARVDQVDPDAAELYRGIEPIDLVGEIIETIVEEALAEEVETVEADESYPASVVFGQQTGSLSPAFFRGLVSEAEKLIDERKAIAEQMRSLRQAAKDRGVNMKAFNELLRRRAMDPVTRNDLDESLAIYERVAGLSCGIIDGGELRATALPAPDQVKPAAKGQAELDAWLNGGIG